MNIQIGLVQRKDDVGSETRNCQTCGRETTHRLERKKTVFTFFGIPLIPIGGKTTAHCNVCGHETSVE